MAVDVGAYALTFLLWMTAAFMGGLVIIGFAIGGMVLWRFLRYKIKVDILEEVGSGHVGREDIAREVQEVDDNGERKTFLRLLKGFKGEKKIPLPEGSTYLPFGNRKKLYLAWKNNMPVPLTVHNPEMAYTNQDLLRAFESLTRTHTAITALYQTGANWWSKYGQYVVPLTLIVLTFAFWLIIFLVTSGAGRGGSPVQLVT